MSYEIPGTLHYKTTADLKQNKAVTLHITDIGDAFESLGPNQRRLFTERVSQDGSIDQDDLKYAAILTSDPAAHRTFLDMAEDNNFQILNADNKGGITTADVKPLLQKVNTGIWGGVIEGKLTKALKKAGTD